MTTEKAPTCPHCGQTMKKWRVPLNSTWNREYFYVCFNDDCEYYKEGWKEMWEQQQTKASYRCRYDPDVGKCLPLPVWSSSALKDDIIE